MPVWPTVYGAKTDAGIPLCDAKKNPAAGAAGFWIKTLAMTYSRMRMHTTIGVCAFHFRVRNGIGWDHAAIITRERVEGRGPDNPGRAHALARLRPAGIQGFPPSANKSECSEYWSERRRVVESKAT